MKLHQTPQSSILRVASSPPGKIAKQILTQTIYRKLQLISPGHKYNFVRGFRWAYNWGSTYLEGLLIGIKHSFGNKRTKTTF